MINEAVMMRMQLKYCEQCGGLWVRRNGENESLCPRCRWAVARIPEAWRGAHTGQKRRCQRVRSWFEARWSPWREERGGNGAKARAAGASRRVQ
jgi:hypothetical protein